MNKIIEEITSRWESTGLLKGVSDKTQASLLLQGQINFNNENSYRLPAQFMRISIPICIRTLFRLSELKGSTEKLEESIVLNAIYKPEKIGSNLNEEAEMVAKLALEISQELALLGDITIHAFDVEPNDGDYKIIVNYKKNY